jgi:regulatory protein
VPARRQARAAAVTPNPEGERSDAGARKALDATALATIAYRHLARRDRSRAELQRVLGTHCDDVDAVEQLLDTLQARGWLSEARMAGQLVDTRRARMGALRIRQELARRGLAAEVIEQATAGLDQSDLATAAALWQKRFGGPAADRKARERQLRFLLSRGFSRAVALKVLRTSGDPDAFQAEE